MTSYLLDTHVLLWLATDNERVPSSLRREIAAASDVFVSAASAYEIAQKTRLGRLPHGGRILARWSHLLDALFATELSLSASHMRTAGEIVWDHRDPFDRMLVAQAQLEGLLLVTKDARLQSYSEVSCAKWA